MTTNGDRAVLVPDYAITIDGRPLPALVLDRVTQISLTRRIDPPDHFSIDLYDPGLELITPPLGPFREGAEITVAVGFLGGVKIAVSGTITAAAVEFPAEGNPVVRVDGFDTLHGLGRGASYRVFPGQGDAGPSDADVVSRIAGEAGLASDAATGVPGGTPRVQNEVSDLAFLRELAAVNGYAIWVDRRTLHVRGERPAARAVDLRRGEDVTSLRLRLSTTGQVAKVVVHGWDPAQKQAFTGSATRASIGPELSPAPTAGSDRTLVIMHARVSGANEAESLAKAVLAEQAKSLVVGGGVTSGRPELDVGTVVKLHGTGRFDGGKYVVTEATHVVSESGYLTEFSLNGAHADGEWTGSATGVAVGVVTDNRDPRGQGRVKVRLAAGGEDGLWARLAAPSAGKDRGAYFPPEPGDEVLLAFEHGHADRPYVVGSLWNGKDTPPAATPDVRVVKSRSGHMVRLDDTDGAEKIELVEKNGRSSVVLDSATGAITVHGSGDVTVEAPEGELRLRGSRIVLDADASIAVRAKGSLDLTGDGPATLRGATVDIN
ncbi:phage baseplate assembly protein V [Actinomadura sp. DC4]|uniref:phage baseplate assembly protein V n=1 Tax=Actinomadura sp. DC4 TaxID=3055069 RepID=UPI0025AEE330|nr:phage baseplate assembly protein V [Actinomadura sp. DC4]MDN3354882.1 phage baseplate assembly protein V [Actinomadura sp. DC4]